MCRRGITWIKNFNSNVEGLLKDHLMQRDILVQIGLHKNRYGEISFAGRPKLEPELEAQLRKAADIKELPHTKIVDFSFQLVYKVNGGSIDKNARFTPELRDPYKDALLQYKNAAIKEKLQSLKKWSKEEVLPVLTAFCLQADERFQGVRSMGAMLEELEHWKRLNIEKLTYGNYDFWASGKCRGQSSYGATVL